MIAREVVRIVRALEQEDGETIQQRYGTQARAAAQSIESLLASRLLEESPHAALWEQFRENPQATAADLTGVLEMIFEADPAFAERIDAFGVAYQDAVRTSETRRQTLESKDVTQIQSDVSRDLAQDVTLNAPVQGQQVDKDKYLYGDTVRENEPATPVAQTEGVSIEGRAQVVTMFGSGESALEVPQLFEQFQRAIRDNPALSDIDKHHLAVEIQAIRRQIVPDETGLRTEPLDEEELMQRLLAIRRIAPDMANILFSELASASQDLPDAAQRAVARVQSPPEA